MAGQADQADQDNPSDQAGQAENLPSPSSSASEKLPLDPDIVQRLSKHSGIAIDRLQLLSQHRFEFPLSGVSAQGYMVADPIDGHSRQVVLDESRELVSLQALRVEESRLHRESFGAASAKFMQRLEQAEQTEPQEPIRVLVQVREPESMRRDSFSKSSDKPLDAKARSNALRQRASLESYAQSYVQQALAKVTRNAIAMEQTSGPFVVLKAAPATLRELAMDLGIQYIGANDLVDAPDKCSAWGDPDSYSIVDAKPATRVNLVHPFNRGAGTRIAVLEHGKAVPSSQCYRLAAIQDPTFQFDTDDHVSGSLSILSNRVRSTGGGTFDCSGDFDGIAPEAEIILANGGNTPNNYDHYASRFNYAVQQQADIISMSWHGDQEEHSGDLDPRDVFFDYASTHYPYPSVFTSAGNEGEHIPTAYASGKGYNFFGVGAVYFNKTPGDRCTHTMNPASSYKNPSTGLEIPEISVPAGDYHFPYLDTPNDSFGCTSAATPTAAAIAALMMSKDSNLKTWPEAVRAIMLATADYQDAQPGSGLDGDLADGAGTINAELANGVAGNSVSGGGSVADRGYVTGSFYEQDFSGSGDQIYKDTWTIHRPSSGGRLRVALTWNSTLGDGGTDVLDGNFDIAVRVPFGWWFYSHSMVNNYEIVDVPLTFTGDYHIEIRKHGNLPQDYSSYFSMAWVTFDEPCP